MSNSDDTLTPRRIRVRLVWRLVLCLFGHLTLLLILALYLVTSLNSVTRYTPIADAEEIQMESVNTLPALLGAMDAERRAYQKTGDPQNIALYNQSRQAVESNLASLNTPLLLATDNETLRRSLVQKWITRIGEPAMNHQVAPGDADMLDIQSGVILQQLSQASEAVRTEVKAMLAGLKNQEASEASGRVTLMWIMVGSVTFFTILIQLALSNSIIAPIKALAGVVRRLQAGDYTVRARLRSGDEIQSLGETFNSMAESILRSQQELQEKNVRLSSQQEALRNANANLEERVAKKTEELQQTLSGAEAERAKLQTLIERMPDGLLLFDHAGKIVLGNEAGLTILGQPNLASLQEWISCPPGAFSFRHLNQQALTDEEVPYRRALRGETFSNVSVYLRGRDKQTRLVSFSGAPVHTPQGGKVELSLLIFRDVTQELALRQELEDKNQKLNQAARLKDEFLATLSHELRTPLTPIISCAHLLGSDPHLEGDHLKSVQVIERNARSLSRMIDELLDLSTVINRKLRLAREKIEMNEWARATVETLRPSWEKKGIQLMFIPSRKPIEWEIDPARLAQVLTNLVNNAIKFTDPQGKITVRLTSTRDEVRLAVTDTGAGLQKHEIAQIFEMFHQSRTRRTEGVGGLGVGLTVARSLAELHGGGLLAESPGPGKGATFTLWLPRLNERAGIAFDAPSLTPRALVDRTLLRGRRILVVEDSTDTREALLRIFQRRECLVTTAASAEEALKLASHQPPEIILSDIGLPGLSGLDLMTQLRARPDFADVVAIALSGLGRDQDVQAAMKAGFDSHLLKPVDIEVLDETLVHALQKKHLGGTPNVAVIKS